MAGADALPGPWPALAAARHRVRARVPFFLPSSAGPTQVGSVDAAHAAMLVAEAPGRWRLGAAGLALQCRPGECDAVLARLGQDLRARGLVLAWRDEPYAVFGPQGQPLAVIERATSRFWGTLTFGAHCNGYVAGAGGRPERLWIARRSLSKPTDPGLLDNLVGGGVPHGQTPREALLREAWEEAGLAAPLLRGLATGRVIALCCDIPEGLQHEWLHVFDLALPPQWQTANQDGEVAEHHLMPVAQALACAAQGDMTVDAALATLDFALRHRLPGAGPALATALAPLLVPPDQAGKFHPAGSLRP